MMIAKVFQVTLPFSPRMLFAYEEQDSLYELQITVFTFATESLIIIELSVTKVSTIILSLAHCSYVNSSAGQ